MSFAPGFGVSIAETSFIAFTSSVFELPKLLPPADGLEYTASTNATAPGDGLGEEEMGG